MKEELDLGNSENSLRQLILKKNEDRAADMDSFFDSLAEKYAPKKKAKKKAN